MSHFNLIGSVHKDFLAVVHTGLESKAIDPAELRMLVATPTPDFSALDILFTNEWEDYLYLEYIDGEPVGRVDISAWLDAADGYLENLPENIGRADGSWASREKEIAYKYKAVPPAIDTNITDDEAYNHLLAGLREDMIAQVEEGLRRAAVELHGHFAHTVGIITKRLTFNDQENNQTVAFCHRLGAGPFFPAKVSLPNITLTYPFLKVLHDGFVLFYTQGDIHDDDDSAKSSVYVYTMDDLKYAKMARRDEEFAFRLNDQFEDWRIDGGHVHEEYGDLQESELLKAFGELLHRHPDKHQDLSMVPHPIAQRPGFKDWVKELVDNNLRISYDQEMQIVGFGDAAVAEAMEVIPETYQYKNDLRRRCAKIALEEMRYERALEFFQAIKDLHPVYHSEVLYLYYVLGRDDEFQTKWQSIQADGKPREETKLPVWLQQIRAAGQDRVKLEALHKEVHAFGQSKKGYKVEDLALFVQCLLECRLGREAEAVLTFRAMDKGQYYLEFIVPTEFQNFPTILAEWETFRTDRTHQKNIETELEAGAVQADDSWEREPVMPSGSDFELLCTSKLENEPNLSWVGIVAHNRVILVTDECAVQLATVDWASEQLLILDTLELDDKQASYRYHLAGSKLFVHRHNGPRIREYNLSEDQFEPGRLFSNRARVSTYQNLTVAGEFLYAATDTRLEIFPLAPGGTSGETGNGEKPVHPNYDSLFIKLPGHSVYYMVENKGRLYLGSSDLLIVDISSPTSPTRLGRVKGFETSGPHGFHFFDHYLVADHLYDMSNPAQPRQLAALCRDHTPLSVFDHKGNRQEHPGVFSCGDDHGLLRQVEVSAEDKVTVRQWLEVWDPERDHQQRSVYNLANLVVGDKAVSFNQYEVYFYKKQSAQHSPVLDGAGALEKAVDRLLVAHADLDSTESFAIGGLLFDREQGGGYLKLVPAVSAPALTTIASPVEEHFSWYEIFKDNDPPFNEQTEVHCDLAGLANFFAAHSKLQSRAAAHVFVCFRYRPGYGRFVTEYARRFNFPQSNWLPSRSAASAGAGAQTTGQVLAGDNRNLLRDLKNRASEDPAVLYEILEHYGEDAKVNSNIRLVIRSLPDNELVKTIYTLGLSGPPHPKDVRAVLDGDGVELGNGAGTGPGEDFLLELTTQLWDRLGSDPNVRRLLGQLLPKLAPPAQVWLAWRLDKFNHPAIITHVGQLLDTGKLDYHTYCGYNYERWLDGLALRDLPADALRSYRPRLETLYAQHKDNGPVEILGPVCHMLFKLGMNELPPLLLQSSARTKQMEEQHDMSWLRIDPDDHLSLEGFLIKLERLVKGQVIQERLKRLEGGEPIALYDPAWEAEPYRLSWIRFWEAVMAAPQAVNVDDQAHYRRRLVDALIKNITVDGAVYDNDRQMALRFLDYVLTQIVEHPDIAADTTRLFQAVDGVQDKLPPDVNFKALRQKGLLALLQEAWNDVKAGNFAAAGSKGDSVLELDPSFGQGWFLKARLLWLEEGVDAYLQQAEKFYQAAAPDKLGLARLYNLTGCAYDERKEPGKAVPYFEKAAVNEPENGMYLANIAECYYKLGDAEKALTYAAHAKSKGHSNDMLSEIFTKQGVKG